MSTDIAAVSPSEIRRTFTHDRVSRTSYTEFKAVISCVIPAEPEMRANSKPNVSFPPGVFLVISLRVVCSN